MPAARIDIKGANPVVGRTNSMTGADILTRLAAKAGLGSDVKAAKKRQNTSDQLYALAVEDSKSGGKATGKTAAVAMKQPNRKTTSAAKVSTLVPKRKPTRAPGTKMTTMARKG